MRLYRARWQEFINLESQGNVVEEWIGTWWED